MCTKVRIILENKADFGQNDIAKKIRALRNAIFHGVRTYRNVSATH